MQTEWTHSQGTNGLAITNTDWGVAGLQPRLQGQKSEVTKNETPSFSASSYMYLGLLL